MAHSHSTGARVTADPRVARVLIGVAIAAGVAVIVALVVLWPRGGEHRDLRSLGVVSDVFSATVVELERGPCAGTDPSDDIECTEVRFRLSAGPDRGEVVTQELPDSTTSPDLDRGDRVVLSYDPEADPEFRYQFADRQRRPVLFALALVFAIAVVLLGRLRGLAALVGLGVSLAVILQFVVPAIVEGRSPVVVAVVGSAAIAYVALYVAGGFTVRTTVALLGTLASLALVVVLSSLFVSLAQLSGFSSEEAVLVQFAAAELDVGGLVLAGVVIGALGALDDMTVTQAATVWELHAANPRLSRRALFTSGLRVGRDHVASTVNTLALAYAGAALPLLILFVLSRQSLGTVANSEVVAIEILRTLLGSIGLVASVPFTTWLATRAVPAWRPVEGSV